jgi:tetratricopeptide (TPR) repeat protein
LALASLFGNGERLFADLIVSDSLVPTKTSWALERLTPEQPLFVEACKLYAEGNIDACRQMLSRLRESDKTLPQPDLVIVWLLLNDRRLTEAKVQLERLSALLSRDPQVAFTIGQLAMAELRLADAAAHLERAALLQMPSTWSPVQRAQFALGTLDTLAIVYERQSRWEDAKAVLTTLISMTQSNENYRTRLARAHYNLGDLAQAKFLLHEAVKLGAASKPVPLLLAELAYAKGDFEQASVSIQEALKADPQNTHVLLWHAEWSLFWNQLDAASQSLAAVEKIGLEASQYWIPAGQLAMMREDYTQAVSLLRNAVGELQQGADANRLASAKNLLALALVCTGNHDFREEARAIAELNAVEFSDHPVHVGTLAWVYSKLSRHEEASLLINRAIELQSRVTSDLSFFAADILANSEDDQAATQTFLKAALDSKQGIFVMRPLAVLLQGKLNMELSAPR